MLHLSSFNENVFIIAPDGMIRGILVLSCLYLTSYLACKWHQGQWRCDLDFDLCAKNSFFRPPGGIVFYKHMYFSRVFRFCPAFYDESVSYLQLHLVHMASRQYTIHDKLEKLKRGSLCTLPKREILRETILRH